MRQMEINNTSLNAVASQFTHVVVDYEKLASDTESTMRNLFDFLGVEPSSVGDVQPTTARQNPEPLSDLIENYDEVCATLKETPYLPLVEEANA